MRGRGLDLHSVKTHAVKDKPHRIVLLDYPKGPTDLNVLGNTKVLSSVRILNGIVRLSLLTTPSVPSHRHAP